MCSILVQLGRYSAGLSGIVLYLPLISRSAICVRGGVRVIEVEKMASNYSIVNNLSTQIHIYVLKMDRFVVSHHLNDRNENFNSINPKALKTKLNAIDRVSIFKPESNHSTIETQNCLSERKLNRSVLI